MVQKCHHPTDPLQQTKMLVALLTVGTGTVSPVESLLREKRKDQANERAEQMLVRKMMMVVVVMIFELEAVSIEDRMQRGQ
jgi:hypothetical protein